MYPCCAMVPCLLYTLYTLLIAFSLYHRNIKVDILANPVGLNSETKGNGQAMDTTEGLWREHENYINKEKEPAKWGARRSWALPACQPAQDPGPLKKMAPACRQRALVSSQLLTSCWSPTLTVSGEDWKLRPLCSYLSVSGSQPWAQDLSTSQNTSAGGQSFQAMEPVQSLSSVGHNCWLLRYVHLLISLTWTMVFVYILRTYYWFRGTMASPLPPNSLVKVESLAVGRHRLSSRAQLMGLNRKSIT